MKIFYFTSTGNCLEVAKRIGGELYSIPQVLKENKLEFEDETKQLPKFLVAVEMIFLVQLIRNAYLIGYQDLNSFTRTFQIWTDMTITEYKKQIT